jgi:glycosyltransferase involved in cell wall biosynthesis
MNPDVSIITICLNDKTGLEKTIDSVSSQKFKNYEFIIIDGGSNDGSIDVIRKNTDLITYWVSEKDSGICNALNKGLKKVQGKYCFFLNSGDTLYDELVIENIFKKERDEDIVSGDIILFSDDGKEELVKSPETATFRHMYFSTLFYPVTFFKYELFINFGGFDENIKLSGDYDIFFRLLIKHNATYKRLPVIVVRFNTSGLSSHSKNAPLIATERKTIHDKYLSKRIQDEFFELNALKYSRPIVFWNWAKQYSILRNGLKFLYHTFKKIR